MDANQPITRAEFLKRMFSIFAVFAVGSLLSQATGASRIFGRGDSGSYGNNTYGGKSV